MINNPNSKQLQVTSGKRGDLRVTGQELSYPMSLMSMSCDPYYVQIWERFDFCCGKHSNRSWDDI